MDYRIYESSIKDLKSVGNVQQDNLIPIMDGYFASETNQSVYTIIEHDCDQNIDTCIFSGNQYAYPEFRQSFRGTTKKLV